MRDEESSSFDTELSELSVEPAESEADSAEILTFSDEPYVAGWTGDVCAKIKHYKKGPTLEKYAFQPDKGTQASIKTTLSFKRFAHSTVE